MSSQAIHPSSLLPDATYWQGLRDADSSIIAAVYNEFRPSILRDIVAKGGSDGDAAIFFRTAVTEAAIQAQQRELPAETPFFYYLKNLATTHFQDWKTEQTQQQAEASEAKDADVRERMADMPSAIETALTRKRIFTLRKWANLPTAQQQVILDAATTSNDESLPTPETTQTALIAFQEALKTDENWHNNLPDYVRLALTDEHFRTIRHLTQQEEQELVQAKTDRPREIDPPNPWPYRILMGLGALFLIYTLYARFFGPKTAKEVYNSHFDAPQSLVEDATTRTQNLPVLEDSLSYAERPPVCDEILTQADEYYKNKAYADAASILAEALDEEALSPCHSDACFYLGIIGLQLDRPMMTVQFFAKIEDLDRYGEDIYWFQALAYVKMAAQNEVDKELARRAVERARDNTEIPERREEAERILKELGQ